jgi:hypothetical protein
LDLPAGFYRQLPNLSEGPFTGHPRVFGLSWGCRYGFPCLTTARSTVLRSGSGRSRVWRLSHNATTPVYEMLNRCFARHPKLVRGGLNRIGSLV